MHFKDFQTRNHE